jgi:parallel beta-helix repeat protein
MPCPTPCVRRAVRGLRRLSAALVLSLTPQALADPVIPSDGMVITEDTTFVTGTYSLPSGVSIGAPGVTLDLNGAVLLGTNFQNFGVTCIGFDNVTVTGGSAHGYYYGLRVETSDSFAVTNCDLSDNWVDPNSLGSNAPWLNINAFPNLSDRVNLGGGLFMRQCSGVTIADNVMTGQENGMDLYEVTAGLITGNDCSYNTGWGIHLNASTDNTIDDNVMDHCIRIGLGDSAGMLLVNASHANTITNNSFTYGGDGFFIGNEGGCPSNDNLLQGNDGSFAGANAFEATFSAGNQFIDNLANGSNYGFWLGYSHSGNVIRGNQIRANNVAGIEIEHGQGNVIEGNEIIFNGGKGIVLRTDGQAHFPDWQFPCLDLPNQELSADYLIKDNIIQANFGIALELTNTTDSTIVNNLIDGNGGGTAQVTGANNIWAVDPTPGTNIVGGDTLGGNYFDNYAGSDTDGDGLGDTDLPYTNDGQIDAPGDTHPLIGDPDTPVIDNPLAHCYGAWQDLGRNTRENGSHFDTANGAHFATDGTKLYLLEGRNSGDFSRYDPQQNRYLPLANLPEGVWDGGGAQYGAGLVFATTATQFNPADGSGKGPRLYAYDPEFDSWERLVDSEVNGQPVANEALAYDPSQQSLYATIVAVMDGQDQALRQCLAIYNSLFEIWMGATSPSGIDFGAGSEIEYLDGKIYAWPGSFRGGAVNGSDSFLLVYDIASDTWDRTASLQDSGIMPGFRSGAYDVWGVTITADANFRRLLVQGGETNHLVYVYLPAIDAWRVTRPATYDGGWGAGLECLSEAGLTYQIDGRNAAGEPQGTAILLPPQPGDLNGDSCVDQQDLGLLLASYEYDGGGDLDCDGDTDQADLGLLLANYGSGC